MTRLLSTHAEHEQRHPDVAAYEHAIEQGRQTAHKTRHGSLENYKPPREFPCPGVLWIQDGDTPVREVRCSACGWETTIREPRTESTATPTGSEW